MAGVRRLVNDLILTPPVPQPMWVEPAILPKGGLLLFGGESKIGKSFLVLEMMRALATGEDMFGNPQFVIPERAKVVLIEQELGDYILRGRAVEVFKEAEEEGRPASAGKGGAAAAPRNGTSAPPAVQQGSIAPDTEMPF